VARFAPLYDVPVAEAEAEVRIVIDRRDKLGLAGPGAAAQEVSIALRIESSAGQEAVALLAAHAERACHNAQSLMKTVPVRHEVYLNGQALPR
jgi:organic hydroperoxide reductase OsmC/OhrA